MAPAASHLDAALRTRKISGRQFAKDTGYSEVQVSRWRNGLTPSEEARSKLASHLGMSVEELWPNA